MNCLNASEIAAYIGFAQRSGAVLYGEERILEKLGRCVVVLIDASAPEKYRERLIKRCGGVPTAEVDDLRLATHRDNVKSIGVTDQSLGNAILRFRGSYERN